MVMTMLALRLAAAAALVAVSSAAEFQMATTAMNGLPFLPSTRSTTGSAHWQRIPRGGGAKSKAAAAEYATKLEAVKTAVLEALSDAVQDLQRQVLDEGQIVEEFGSVADTLCNQALEQFAAAAPDVGSDVPALVASEAAAAYDAKLAELEAALDAPLQLLYCHQLALLRDLALQRFRTAAATRGLSPADALQQATAEFATRAAAATRDGWDSAAERTALKRTLQHMVEAARQSQAAQQVAVQHQTTAMQFLQYQKQMMDQLQMQLYSQTTPWNVGMAYRIPDTNFNLYGVYEQGGNVKGELTCVPDDYAPFLGPNGFVHGVGPANVGISISLKM